MTWRITQLGECIQLFSGGTPSKRQPALWAGDIPWVSCKDMKLLRISDTEDHVNQAAIGNGTRIVSAGTILIVVRGMILAKDFPVAEAQRALAFNQDLKAIAVNEGTDSRFLLYWFLANRELLIGSCDEAAHGTKRLQTDRLLNMQLALPPVDEQRRIASILSAYDDLIENNTRRIAILEEMARRIYEEWFVHFRFPGHQHVRMVESELGPVPEGWSIKGLYDVAELTYGFPFKSKLFDTAKEGVAVIRIRDIKGDQTNTYTTEPADLKYRVRNGDILVGMDGEFHMGCWAGGDAWLNQRVVRFRSRDGIPQPWLFLTTRGPIKVLESTIVGTTVAHLSARDLKEMRIVLPSSEVLKHAGEALEPLFDLALTLKLANANLRTSRDLLLPKLISGELDVSALPESQAVAA